jgi:hypothetical protein
VTPLQVIMLTHEVRKAQKAYLSAAKGETPLMDRHTVMADLEDKLDAALGPYVNYCRSLEILEADNGD